MNLLMENDKKIIPTPKSRNYKNFFGESSK